MHEKIACFCNDRSFPYRPYKHKKRGACRQLLILHSFQTILPSPIGIVIFLTLSTSFTDHHQCNDTRSNIKIQATSSPPYHPISLYCKHDIKIASEFSCRPSRSPKIWSWASSTHSLSLNESKSLLPNLPLPPCQEVRPVHHQQQTREGGG